MVPQDLEAVISQGWALAKCQQRPFALLDVESSETRDLGQFQPKFYGDLMGSNGDLMGSNGIL